MNALILEPSDRISKLYQKILSEKNIDSFFVNNEEECLGKFASYDLIILEKPVRLPDGMFLENKLTMLAPEKKIFTISSYVKENPEISKLTQETREIIEKPFALLNILIQMDLPRAESILIQ